MDPLTFISKLVESLAWPISSIMLVLLLRKELKVLLPFVKRLKAGPVEAEFDRDTKEIQKNIQSDAAQKSTDIKSAPSKELLLQLAEVHPRSAVLEAWLRVEAAAKVALDKKTGPVVVSGIRTNRKSIVALAEDLRQNEILHEGQLNIFHELRNLRNEVVHVQGFTPTEDAVTRYIDAASYLQWWLEEAAK